MDTIDQLDRGVDDVEGLLELAIEAEDQETFDEIGPELDELEAKLEQLEFRRMFSGDHDSSDCYLDLQAGLLAVQKRKIGRRCCCACTCAGQMLKALKPK